MQARQGSCRCNTVVSPFVFISCWIMEFCAVVELSDDTVGSDLEITFPLVPGEGEMLWSCVQYCQGYDDSLYEKQSDIQQLDLFSEHCSESSGVFPFVNFVSTTAQQGSNGHLLFVVVLGGCV